MGRNTPLYIVARGYETADLLAKKRNHTSKQTNKHHLTLKQSRNL